MNLNKMKNTGSFFLLFLISINCISLPDSLSSDALRSMVGKLKKHRSVSYRINYFFKYFSDADTLNFKADCSLIRTTEDSLFNGIFWVRTSDSLEKYYNGHSIFSINNNSRTITEYQAPARNRWTLKDRHVEDLIKTFFLKPDFLIEIIKDTVNLINAIDTIVLGKEYIIVSVLFPDEVPFNQDKWRIWIYKDEGTIKRITWHIMFQNNCQYTQWDFDDYKFDTDTREGLAGNFLELYMSYKTEVYVEKQDDTGIIIQKGENAPDFSGKYYPDSTGFRLSDLKGKLVLLDFWFMSCYPCILSIPHLSKLLSEYENRGLVVIGIDYVDRNIKEKSKLNEFIRLNKMNYPIVFVDKEISDMFHVKAFPMLYLLNKNQIVIFSQRGFQADMYNQIKRVIEEELDH